MSTSIYNGIQNNTHPNWWMDKCLRKNAFWLMICAMGSVYAGYDGSLLNGLQALPKFYESFPRLETDSNLLGLTGAAQFLPGLVVPVFASWIADRYGRKCLMFATALGICVGAVVQCTSNNLGVFIFSRVLVGIFGTCGYVVNPTMLVELAHPRIRSTASALNLTCYYIGSIIASWTTFGTLQNMPTSSWSWRIPSLFQALIPFLIVVPIYFMPPSPRWLIAVGRVDEARKVLANQHANGDYDDPLILVEIDEIQRALEDEKQAAAGSSSWMSFFKTKGNRWRLFIVVNIALGAQWNGAGIISYYLVPVLRSVGITQPTPQTLITGGLAISNWFFAIAGALLVEKLGRRPLWFISTGGMLITFVVVTALSATFAKSPSPAIGGTVIAFLYLFYGAYDVAWTPLNLAYTVEILPYNIRAKGMGIWTFGTSVGLCLNTWVNPIALEAIQYNYYYVYIGVLIYLLVIIYFFFPETKGLSLEEVAVRFDGESALLENIRNRTAPEEEGRVGSVAYENKGETEIESVEKV